jgi:hypothetical protein
MTAKTAAKTRQPKKLALTSRAKMGDARKPKPAKPAPDLKATLEASLAAVAEKAAPLTTTIGLDDDAGVPTEQIGEVVTPAKAKIDHSDTLLALLDRPEQVTPRAMMDATSLSRQGVNLAVGQLLKARGLKVTTQKNPTPDPADRKNTSFLYGVEKA